MTAAELRGHVECLKLYAAALLGAACALQPGLPMWWQVTLRVWVCVCWILGAIVSIRTRNKYEERQP